MGFPNLPMNTSTCPIFLNPFLSFFYQPIQMCHSPWQVVLLARLWVGHHTLHRHLRAHIGGEPAERVGVVCLVEELWVPASGIGLAEEGDLRGTGSGWVGVVHVAVRVGEVHQTIVVTHRLTRFTRTHHLSAGERALSQHCHKGYWARIHWLFSKKTCELCESSLLHCIHLFMSL